MNSLFKYPLFLGLTHIGQVFSIGWSEKISACSVYDFNTVLLDRFKNSTLTDEEPGLKKLFKKNKKKIYICSSKNEIKKYQNIFLTIDTPLTQNGKPDYNYIKKYLRESVSYFKKNANIIITSQVYCGFCDEIKKSIFKNRKDINIIYMAETLVMGNALQRFLEPERLIFGSEKKIQIFKTLKKFKCPIFILKHKQAEMIKMAINLFLVTSVSYANLLDLYCREYGFKFSSINKPIKLDKRIGLLSYISPSLGISGGHLERDLFSIIKTTKNSIVKKSFSKFQLLNKERLNLLFQLFDLLRKKNKFSKIIWVGPSYKKDSFSILNSPYFHFKKYLNKKGVTLFSYDSFFDLEKNKIKNVIKKINKSTFNKSLVIYNYLGERDLFLFIKLLKGNYIKSIDVNFSNNKLLKNKNNTSLLN